ncbi:prephenate dehydrogenase/arogenate dehydrogenase family protein [Robbsia sp. KACC 23696]|uniref:prephenate dehydrogenase n=1 Tax=Robbsia sp. KACC 23696 TaxID=3149231 RepID=UPI00325ACFAB
MNVQHKAVDPAAQFDTLLVCGVGLIGGSFARALREAHHAGRVGGIGRIVGVDRDPAALAQARSLGVIDEGVVFDGLPAMAAPTDALPTVDGARVGSVRASSGGTPVPGLSLSEQIAQADVIVLCMPVAASVALLQRIAQSMRADAVLTDVGSTKQDICTAAAASLGPMIDRFVAGHPIAGAASSGIAASTADLFQQRDVILCPLEAENAGPTERVTALWQAVGARVRLMSATTHDAVFASVSHLPHLLAFAYITHILETSDPVQRFAMAGTGFRDFSRIAASSPDMWRDICVANRDAILTELDAYTAVLARLRTAVDAGDTAATRALFDRARDARAGWTMGAAPATSADKAQ